MNLASLHRDKCTLEVQDGHDSDGPTWATLGTEIPCRIERHVMNKDKFQKVEAEGLSRASFPIQLDIQQTYRICLSEDDSSDVTNFHETAVVQVCFDRHHRFIHSVIWF